MAYFPKKSLTKKEFVQERIAMSFGSICNLYSGTQKPPTSKEVYEEAMEITEKEWGLGQRFDPFLELDKKLEEHFKEEQHEKKVGRYSSSELWGLFNDRIKPEDYLKPRVFDEESKKKMFWGTIVHEGIAKLFNFEEKKYEIEIPYELPKTAKEITSGVGLITIVCKIDLELEDKIFEFKTREDIESFEEVPSWYNLQCQAYLQAKDLKEMKLYLIGWGLTRRLFIVKRDKRIWDYIVKELTTYHQKVLKINLTNPLIKEEKELQE